jgi:hypothetical protein
MWKQDPVVVPTSSTNHLRLDNLNFALNLRNSPSQRELGLSVVQPQSLQLKEDAATGQDELMHFLVGSSKSSKCTNTLCKLDESEFLQLLEQVSLMVILRMTQLF